MKKKQTKKELKIKEALDYALLYKIKLKGKKCYGKNLIDYANKYKTNPTNINLSWIIDSYNSLKKENDFFTNYFDKLAGNSNLRNQIIEGKTEKEIRNSWKPDLKKFKKIRKKYLLYPDF